MVPKPIAAMLPDFSLDLVLNQKVDGGKQRDNFRYTQLKQTIDIMALTDLLLVKSHYCIYLCTCTTK